MGLASITQNCVQSPLKFELGFLRISPLLSPTQFPNWVRFQHTKLLSPPFASVGCRYRRRHHSLIACSRGTEQEEESSTSVGETSSSPSYDDIDGFKSSRIVKSAGDSEDITRGPDYVSSVRTVALWVCAAVAFGVGLGLKDGVGRASEFFAGYLLEQSLSVDNLFVFVLIFKYFKVPYMYQNRVLSYGIAGAIIFRLSVILLGTATLQRFEAVNLLLAIVLLYSSFKLFAGEDEDSDLSDNFVVKTCQRFIPVTSNYDGNRFLTVQDGVWKASNVLGRLPLYFSQ